MSRVFAQSTLGDRLGVADADEDELYDALDWLLTRQPRIESALARRHLRGGTLVLYDVSSSYFEGRACPLAQPGYSRDGRRGMAQIVYGLLCDRRGCPVAVEVFEGSLHDDKTLPSQLEKLRLGTPQARPRRGCQPAEAARMERKQRRRHLHPPEEATPGPVPLRRMIRAGTPTAMQSSGTLWSTTALAPMVTRSPIAIGPRIFAPAPMSTSSPIVGTPFCAPPTPPITT
jgi:hypothetical protein